jgi:hypothetical protein
MNQDYLRLKFGPQLAAKDLSICRYSLASVVAGQCVLRYDNERGKVDHRHADGKETPCVFTTPTQLLADFWADVDQRRPE